jgi:transposase
MKNDCILDVAMPLPPAVGLTLSDAERKQLEALGRQRSSPRGIVLRINIVLGAAEGLANRVLARKLSTSVPTVLLWRKRFEADGIAGLLEDRPRSGRPKRISEQTEAAIVEATMKTIPKDATQWSIRAMATAQKVSSATVHRIWKKHKLQPHRVESFKFSSDPQFARKVRDIVGLYMNPPDKAIVLSVDEKSQIQALDRTQPGLPMKKGRGQTMTHDYKRNGTTTLFAALNTANGEVYHLCQQRHRHQEWLKFLRMIDQTVPADKQIHVICDNYGTHKHERVQRWLERHQRFHVHFTPTSASWLNMIERFFRDLTENRIRRGAFKDLEQLIMAIGHYIDRHNESPKPFIWTAKANDILEKVTRARAALNK